MCTVVRMSQLAPVRPDPDVRRARIAVGALFFTNGALFANLIPRYPQIKAHLGMTNAEYGLCVAAFPAGALIAGTAAGMLIRRFGSPTVAALGTVLVGIGVVLAGLAPATVVFALALFLAGSMDAITDVAQNAHGLRVQRRYGRSIINSFHAIWSIGAVTGGLMAAGAIGLGIPREAHLTIAAVLLAAVALLARGFCLPGPDAEPVETRSEQPIRTAAIGLPTVLTVGALVLIAIAGTTVEDAGNSWATLYLSDSLGAAAAVAALGYIALVGAQFVGRIFGDRLVDAFGQRTIARAGGVVGPPEWAWPWRSRPFRARFWASPPPGSASRPWCPPPCTRPTNFPASSPGPG